VRLGVLQDDEEYISPLVLGLALDRDCLILLFQRGVLLLLAGDGDSLLQFAEFPPAQGSPKA